MSLVALIKKSANQAKLTLYSVVSFGLVAIILEFCRRFDRRVPSHTKAAHKHDCASIILATYLILLVSILDLPVSEIIPQHSIALLN